jgi:hypothetical protein
MTLEKTIELAGKEKFLEEKTELGEVMKNLDSDEIDASTGMSSIDFNSRLRPSEIRSVIIIDELVRLGLFPKIVGITRQKKRLSVSLEGKGREEKVRIVAGERDFRGGGTIGERLKSFFMPK